MKLQQQLGKVPHKKRQIINYWWIKRGGGSSYKVEAYNRKLSQNVTPN